MSRPLAFGFPSLAPLQTPMALWLFQELNQNIHFRLTALAPLEDQIAQILQEFRTEWQQFEQQVARKRSFVFGIMNARIGKTYPKSGQFSPRWLRENLSFCVEYERKAPQAFLDPSASLGGLMSSMPLLDEIFAKDDPYVDEGESVASEEQGERTDLITQQAMNGWYDRHMLRQIKKGVLDPLSVPQVLIASMLLQRARNFLPPDMSEHEPLMWCYVQEEPNSPIYSMPYPFMNSFKPKSIIWMPWPGVGAAWGDPRWIVFPPLGAITLGATLMHHGEVRFAGIAYDKRHREHPALTNDDLYLWEPALRKEQLEVGGFGLLGASVESTARYVLFLQAKRRFSPSFPLPFPPSPLPFTL